MSGCTANQTDLAYPLQNDAGMAYVSQCEGASPIVVRGVDGGWCLQCAHRNMLDFVTRQLGTPLVLCWALRCIGEVSMFDARSASGDFDASFRVVGL